MMSPRPIIFLVFALCFLASRLPAGPVEDGEEALRNGQAELALRFFKVAIQTNPDNDRAWNGYRQASAQAAMGKSGPRGSSIASPPLSTKLPVANPVLQEVPAMPDATAAEVANRYLRGQALFYSKDLERHFKRLPKNLRLAQLAYDQEKEALTRYYTRKRGGSLAVSATLMTPKLYTTLAKVRAIKGKLTAEGAKDIWLREGDKSFRTLEFYIVVKNLTHKGGLSAQRRKLDISDIENQVFLEDDRGVRYEPYKKEAPKTDMLSDMDSFSVWFAPISRSGSPLWEAAVSELRLVVEGVEGEAQRIVFPFPKNVFRRMLKVDQ
jgi:hypothetical protein